jgi:hypothetical protein
MKTKRITLDFSDSPELLEMVKAYSVAKGKTQKDIFSEALQLYFSLNQENIFIHKIAEKMFAEWDNKVDSVYDNM